MSSSSPDHDTSASREEIIASLNELLEAERAGVRVAHESARLTEPEGYSDLMLLVRKDEADWCAMLSRHIGALGAEPSRKTGSFYGKAMAIDDPIDRLAFLNRGQAWVERRITALLPRLPHGDLSADLSTMARRHSENIALASEYLDRAGSFRSA